MRLSPDGALYFLVEEWLPMGLLKCFRTDFVVPFAEQAVTAEGFVPAFGADPFPVHEHRHTDNQRFQSLGHRLIHCPRDSPQSL